MLLMKAVTVCFAMEHVFFTDWQLQFRMNEWKKKAEASEEKWRERKESNRLYASQMETNYFSFGAAVWLCVFSSIFDCDAIYEKERWWW